MRSSLDQFIRSLQSLPNLAQLKELSIIGNLIRDEALIRQPLADKSPLLEVLFTEQNPCNPSDNEAQKLYKMRFAISLIHLKKLDDEELQVDKDTID